jgi:hypothetical protein
LVTGDGSARLTLRDPRTLAKTGELTVTEDGRPVTSVNELECADHAAYANVLPAERIVRIDPITGAVTASNDASGLLHADERVPRHPETASRPSPQRTSLSSRASSGPRYSPSCSGTAAEPHRPLNRAVVGWPY